MVCATVGWLPLPVRSGQLCILKGKLACGTSDAVAQLRLSGLAPRVAALKVFKEACSEDHSLRAGFIRALLSKPDSHAKAMAYNISVPTVLRS